MNPPYLSDNNLEIEQSEYKLTKSKIAVLEILERLLKNLNDIGYENTISIIERISNDNEITEEIRDVAKRVLTQIKSNGKYTTILTSIFDDIIAIFNNENRDDQAAFEILSEIEARDLNIIFDIEIPISRLQVIRNKLRIKLEVIAKNLDYKTQ